MNVWTYESTSEDQTAALGAALAELLPERAVVTLDGTLGAGKTRFVQGLAAAAGVDRRLVVSPTFTLVQEYDGCTPIYHFDAYRIHGDDEFLDLGFEEYTSGAGWCLIEWSDRVARCLPAERLEIRIEVTGEETRQFTFTARGGELEAVLDGLSQRFRGSGE